MYWQNEKISKLWALSIFLTKEDLNKYIKLLCEMKLRDKLRTRSVKKVFLEISQNLPENSLFLNKDAGLRAETLLKRDSNTSVLTWILWNFLWATFLQKPCGGCFFRKDLFLSIFCTEKSFNQIFSKLLV